MAVREAGLIELTAIYLDMLESFLIRRIIININNKNNNRKMGREVTYNKGWVPCISGILNDRRCIGAYTSAITIHIGAVQYISF